MQNFGCLHARVALVNRGANIIDIDTHCSFVIHPTVFDHFETAPASHPKRDAAK